MSDKTLDELKEDYEFASLAVTMLSMMADPKDPKKSLDLHIEYSAAKKAKDAAWEALMRAHDKKAKEAKS